LWNGYPKNVHAWAVGKLLAGGEQMYIDGGVGWFDVRLNEIFYSILMVLILTSSCYSNSLSESSHPFTSFIWLHLPYGTSTSTPSTASPAQNHGLSSPSSDKSPASAADSTATCAAFTSTTEPQSALAGQKSPSSPPTRGRRYTDMVTHSYRTG